MITADGYSKDTSIIPQGIVVAWGKDLIEEKGGLLSFLRFFKQCMAEEDGIWMQKCKNKPTQDNRLLYVYIIVAGQIKYRCFYAGYASGETDAWNGDGYSWSSKNVITWPRVLLAGPVEIAPVKIYQKGFQGFRYCTKLF